MPAHDKGLDVLRLVEWCLRDRITLMEMCRLLINDWAEVESGLPEVRRPEEVMYAAEKDLEAPHVARVRVEELMAGRASMVAGTTPARRSVTFRSLEFVNWGLLQQNATGS